MDPHVNTNRNHLVKRNGKFVCTICGFQARQYRQFDRHSLQAHACNYCGQIVQNLCTHACPQQEQARQVGGGPLPPGPFLPQNIESEKFELVQQAHLGTIVNFRHYFDVNFVYIESAVDYLYPDLLNLIRQLLNHYKSVKMMFKIVVRMWDNKKQEEREIPTASPYITLLHENFIHSCIKFGIDYIINVINLFGEDGSGFTVDGIISFEVEFGQLRQIQPTGYIPTPKSLKRKRGLLNIKSSLNNCYMLCILAHFFRDRLRLPLKPRLKHEKMNPTERMALKRLSENPLSYYEFRGAAISDFNIEFDEFEDAVSIDDISDWEDSNSHISVNLYGYDGSVFHPIRLTRISAKYHVNLLVLRSATLPVKEHPPKWGKNPPEHHYVLITDLSLLLSKVKSSRVEHCKWCLQPFGVGGSHEENCRLGVSSKLKCYPEGTTYKFKHMYMKFDVMHRVYFDLECYNVKYHTCAPKVDPSKLSYTRVESNFMVAAFGLSLVGYDGTIIYQRYYCEENVMEELFKTIFKIERELYKKHLEDVLQCNPTATEIEEFKVATLCYECQQPFRPGNEKVAHHHHYIVGHPVIPLCNTCNLAIQHKFMVPVFSHYGTGFDHMFILKSLTSDIQQKVELICKNEEKFMSITIGNIRFLDSCQFLNCSLEKLVRRLKGKGTPEELKRLQPVIEGFDNHPHVSLLFDKQYLPYDWLDSPTKLDFPRLPPREDFYNKLNDETITEAQYEHATRVWTSFGCKSFKDYLLIYLKADVLLLQAVFENFIKTCYNIFKLSPVFSYSLSGYAYHISMYYEKQDWEFLSDVSMIEMVKSAIRGGVCYVTKRRSVALSESLGDHVKDSSKRKEILYCDFNNLYGSQLMAPMPHSEYKWLTEDEIKVLDVKSLPEDGDRGWILEVDLVYDKKLHDAHNNFPLAPEKLSINRSDLSPLQQQLLAKYSDCISNPLGGEKLLLTLHDKKKYTVYYKLLKFYLRHGLILGPIHRVFTFKEKPIFKNFIEANLELRREANDEFTKSFFKLIINSIYGKVLNVKPRTIVKFCNNRVDCLKFLSAHNFKSVKMINDDVSLFFMEGQHTVMNKPFFAGFLTLELSKLAMYEMYYDVLVKKFGDRVCNLYSDTDSLILEILDKDQTLIDDLKSIGEHFDFSTLDPDHPLHSIDNKGIAGKLKIEYSNVREVVALKGKQYSVLLKCMKCPDGTTEQENVPCTTCYGVEQSDQKCKGVPQKALKRITHEMFVAALYNNEISYIESRSIRSRDCVLDIIFSSRIGMHNMDLRRWLWDDNINTFALGHYKIPSLP